MSKFLLVFILGVITMIIAIIKGRSPVWFFAGAIFGFFGIAAILFMPNLKSNPVKRPFTPQPQPEERTDDYVPPIMKKDDYKSKSVDVGFEVVEDDFDKYK